MRYHRVGRPLKGEARRVRLSFTLPPTHATWLRTEAREGGVSRSDLLEKILRDRMGERVRLTIPKDKIAAFCTQYGIKQFSLFGSVLRPDFRPESDVDILVEFTEGKTPGLLTMVQMEKELSAMLGGRAVDLKTEEELSPHFRDAVRTTAEVLYAA